MQGKNIRYHLSKKIQDWANSVDDSEIKDLILTKTMITGGAIVSLLQGEMPHDYDVYFRDGQSLLKVAEYYVKKYIASAYPEIKEDEVANCQSSSAVSGMKKKRSGRLSMATYQLWTNALEYLSEVKALLLLVHRSKTSKTERRWLKSMRMQRLPTKKTNTRIITGLCT